MVREVYANLYKPFFAVPSKIFRPLWFFMFTLMFIAALILFLLDWRADPTIRIAMLALILHGACDAFFLDLFFAKQKRALASLDVIMAFIFLGAAVYLFYNIEPLAGYFLLPPLLWLGYLSVLCISVWLLNC